MRLGSTISSTISDSALPNQGYTVKTESPKNEEEEEVLEEEADDERILFAFRVHNAMEK